MPIDEEMHNFLLRTRIEILRFLGVSGRLQVSVLWRTEKRHEGEWRYPSGLIFEVVFVHCNE